MQKECTECHNFLDISLFPSFKRKSGKVYVLNQCIACNKQYKKNHYTNNKEIYKENNQKYVEENREEFNQYHKQYRNENKEKISVYHKEYYQQNKDELNSYKSDYNNERSKTDVTFKLRRGISKLIGSYLKRVGARKNNKSVLDHVGYSIQELKDHLENQFKPWMSWNNWGTYNKDIWNDSNSLTWTWQIDHIIPQTKLPYLSMEDENFKKCWALENLRPISSKDNLLKGNK